MLEQRGKTAAAIAKATDPSSERVTVVFLVSFGSQADIIHKTQENSLLIHELEELETHVWLTPHITF